MISSLRYLTGSLQAACTVSVNVHATEDPMETVLQQLTRGNALFLILILGIGGSFQSGYHITGLSSPSPFIQRFINNTWYERYAVPPAGHTVTIIWSLIVSMYAVGGIFGAVSIKCFSGLLGRKKAVICNSCIAIAAAGIMLTMFPQREPSAPGAVVGRGLGPVSWGPRLQCVHAPAALPYWRLHDGLSHKGLCLWPRPVIWSWGRRLREHPCFLTWMLPSLRSLALGMSTHLMYLGEISPRKIRGVVTVSSVTFKSLGKLSAQFLGLSEILGCEELWNVVLCVPACLSVVQVLVMPYLPEAPRYLFIEKRDDKACKNALQSLWGQGDFKQEMEEMLSEQATMEAVPAKSPLLLLRDRTVRWQLITMSTIYCCNQLSGMAMISTFAFDIFRSTGIPTDQIRYMTIGLGITEIITSISCGLLIEHAGRRPLFWGGYGIMSACWLLVTVVLNLKGSSSWAPYVTTVLIILFIIFFCGGPGGASGTLNSEIFIQSNRVAAFVLFGVQSWFVLAVLGLVFPILIDALESYCFVIFACMCLLGCVYVFFFLPETKGKTLLEITDEFEAITICGKSFREENRLETKL
ncbi:solute carrier family 2 member 9, like 1 isoform X2 [Phyllopteryx taeniolatus]|uniref:solute carrier family 2 member 9, like 1 isoform X2 n=1 Tax=Phyllopteryx taeniolatus TaxID=161469 RepID=UPI002AD4258A|nr:solute carrier family 2 member 9, like 1 isoform X2 [Phyllopteryx taeniolatus]